MKWIDCLLLRFKVDCCRILTPSLSVGAMSLTTKIAGSIYSKRIK